MSEAIKNLLQTFDIKYSNVRGVLKLDDATVYVGEKGVLGGSVVR